MTFISSTPGEVKNPSRLASLIMLPETAAAPYKGRLHGLPNHLAANLTTQTVNNHVAMFKMIFRSARRDGLLVDNPVEFVTTIRERGAASNKRPSTLAELQAVLAVADDEWRSLIMFGLYSGQRLSDLALQDGATSTWNEARCA